MIYSNKAKLQNKELLSSLAIQKLKICTKDYCLLKIDLSLKEPLHLLFSSNETVLNLISFLQVQLYCSKSSGKIFELNVYNESRQLKNEETIGSLFTTQLESIDMVQEPE